MPAQTPAFRDLDGDECAALLASHHVGRIAFSFRDRVDIEPIHYVYEDGWLYGRTGDGTKLRALAHNRWVAFEVDEVSALFSWRSVVVKGALYLLERDGGGSMGDDWRFAVEQLRRLIPQVFQDDDPTPDRFAVFRIHVDQITGRAAWI